MDVPATVLFRTETGIWFRGIPAPHNTEAILSLRMAMNAGEIYQ